MASKSKLTKPPQWWKHLKWCKRVFWKKERQNEKEEIKLNEEESRKLAEILLSPPKETEELKRAWQIYKKNVQEIDENRIDF